MIVEITKENSEDVAYSIFCSTYPHEAYEQDPIRFCNHVRSTGPQITDEEIRKALIETER